MKHLTIYFLTCFFISFQMNFTESFIKARRRLYHNVIKMSTSFWFPAFIFSFFISGINFLLSPLFQSLLETSIPSSLFLCFYVLMPPFNFPPYVPNLPLRLSPFLFSYLHHFSLRLVPFLIFLYFLHLPFLMLFFLILSLSVFSFLFPVKFPSPSAQFFNVAI